MVVIKSSTTFLFFLLVSYLFIQPPKPAALDYETQWDCVPRILVHEHCRCTVAHIALECLSSLSSQLESQRERAKQG